MIRTVLALLPQGSTPRLIAHLLLTVVSVALRATSAVLLVPLVAALFGGDPETAWPWVALLAAVVGAGWVIDWFVARLAFALGFGVLADGQLRIAERLDRIRIAWFDAERTPIARQAVAAIGPDLVGLFVYLATPLIASVLLPIAIAIGLFAIAPPLGLAALAGVPLLLGAYWASGRLSRAADHAVSSADIGLTERILEFARTQPALRAARRVDPASSAVGAALESQHRATLRLLTMQVPGQLIFSIASQLALILLVGTAVRLAIHGSLGAPEAIALIVVITRYLEPFTSLSGIAAAASSVTAMLRRIREVLTAPTVTAGRLVRASSEPPRLELRGVSFGYDEEPPVLSDLDLVCEAGTTTAIVGPSGSGKSTILALCAGLQYPTAGTVLIDGVDAAEFDASTRRALTSVVFQEPYLFDTSIRENVLMGDPSASDEARDRAAALARVDTLVTGLPDGWETRVGESGAQLSGGERQRVSIARALLKPAPMLLVDEATSALDAENEAAVADSLTGDPLPRTRVIVAHRLSSIRAADRIVFVESGRVVEQGTYDDLLASGGRFAQFHAQQHAAAQWRLGS